jgi:hypothetical protein
MMDDENILKGNDDEDALRGMEESEYTIIEEMMKANNDCRRNVLSFTTKNVVMFMTSRLMLKHRPSSTQVRSSQVSIYSEILADC